MSCFESPGRFPLSPGMLYIAVDVGVHRPVEPAVSAVGEIDADGLFDVDRAEVAEDRLELFLRIGRPLPRSPQAKRLAVLTHGTQNP